MTFRYSKWLAYLRFAAALAMAVTLYIGTKPMLWGWLLFAPLFLFVVYEGVRSYSYSLTVDDGLIFVGGLKQAKYRISDITDIHVWVAKGGRIAVVTFADRRKLSFPGHLTGFKYLVELLRNRSNLKRPEFEP